MSSPEKLEFQHESGGALRAAPTEPWEWLLRLRYKFLPDYLVGEILSKRWTETAIPVIVLVIVAATVAKKTTVSLLRPRSA